MSAVSLETKKYLDSIVSRVHAYAKIKERTVDYLEDLEEEDPTVWTNCMIVATLWLASVRDEELTEQDLLMFLGLDDEQADKKVMKLDPEVAEMGFEEAIEYCMMNLD